MAEIPAEAVIAILTLAGVVVGAVSVELAQGRLSRDEARLLPLGRIADTTPPITAEIEGTNHDAR